MPRTIRFPGRKERNSFEERKRLLVVGKPLSFVIGEVKTVSGKAFLGLVPHEF